MPVEGDPRTDLPFQGSTPHGRGAHAFDLAENMIWQVTIDCSFPPPLPCKLLELLDLGTPAHNRRMRQKERREDTLGIFLGAASISATSPTTCFQWYLHTTPACLLHHLHPEPLCLLLFLRPRQRPKPVLSCLLQPPWFLIPWTLFLPQFPWPLSPRRSRTIGLPLLLHLWREESCVGSVGVIPGDCPSEPLWWVTLTLSPMW